MKKDSRVYLFHIRDALDAIERFTVDGKKAFLADEKTQDAVIYNLAIIGEAVKNLPTAIRDSQPSIPWKSIAGMRDIVIHDYESTSVVRVWNVVFRDVPKLRRSIAKMLRDIETSAKRASKAA